MILLRMLFKYWTGRWRQRWRNGSVSALRTADRSPVPPVQIWEFARSGLVPRLKEQVERLFKKLLNGAISSTAK